MAADTPQKKDDQKNRRRAPRRKPRGYVRLECRKGTIGLGPNLGSTILDVSETGARLITSQELQEKQQVEVVLSAQGIKDAIKRLGVIRWQVKLEDGKFCIGVEFEKRLEYRDFQNLSSPN